MNKHAELIKLYARDWALHEDPWSYWEFRDRNSFWQSMTHHPTWNEDNKYRRKVQHIKIGSISVPEPCRELLERGQEYYVVALPGRTHYIFDTWEATEAELYWLKHGLVHLTKEAASLHAKALLQFTLVVLEEDV